MALFAIGDIHGCSTALDLILESFHLGPGDTVVTLGDHVDRGPDSSGVLERLIAMHRTGRLVALRGNHELMMLEAREDPASEAAWRQVGGDATLASYGDRIGADDQQQRMLSDVPESHWDFICNDCLDYWECETHFFVHANAYPDYPLFEQPDYMLFWEKFNEPPVHVSGKIMVCGHTCQKSGVPLNIGHAICLDTWAYGRGWLSCLNIETGEVWQANQAGMTRQLSLR